MALRRTRLSISFTTKPHAHRMPEVGRDLWRPPAATPCSSRDTEGRLGPRPSIKPHNHVQLQGAGLSLTGPMWLHDKLMDVRVAF